MREACRGVREGGEIERKGRLEGDDNHGANIATRGAPPRHHRVHNKKERAHENTAFHMLNYAHALDEVEVVVRRGFSKHVNCAHRDGESRTTNRGAPPQGEQVIRERYARVQK